MHSGFARKVFENDLIVCNTEDFIVAVEWVREIKPQLHTYWVLTNCFAVGEYDMSQKHRSSWPLILINQNVYQTINYIKETCCKM